MPYYADSSPYFYAGGSYAKHSSLMTGVNRYFHPIAAKYSPNLSTISEKPIIVRRRHIPSISTTPSVITSIARPHRIIDTADIDVSRPPRREHLAQESRPHRLRRDRPTIKIRSQALKDNPALREYNEKHEKTVGELLVEKFMIKDKQNDESGRKIKLYHQASLISNDTSTDPSLIDKEDENEILSAIRHRITRRMTRRRSSADVIPLDPEQIKREAALLAAQTEALDSLVAEEQAEIEVEVRRGTFAKRHAMRLPAEISEVSGSDDDMQRDDRKDHKSKKHGTKKKKRKKIDDKPLPELVPFNDVVDENLIKLEIPENGVEEEFEWDDREKCDDIREIISLKDELIENEVNINENQLIKNTGAIKVDHKVKRDEEFIVKPKEKNTKNEILEEKVNIQIDHERLLHTAKKGRVEKNKNVQLEKHHEKVLAKIENKLQVEGNLVNELKKSHDSKPMKKHITSVKEEVKPKLKHSKKFDVQDTVSETDLKGAEPEFQQEESDTFPGFKVEACNSVGDFSTLYVKTANSPSETIRTVEQFRESIRLPAPKRPELSAIETEVVLPVRKPYIRDTSRNSAYLALKPSQLNNNNMYLRGVGPDDGSSIIIDTTRKESGDTSVATLIDSRPANSTVIDAEHQSKIESDLIISEEEGVSAISCDTVSQPPDIEEKRDDELRIVDIKLEPATPSTVIEKIGCSALRGGEEFISWWDESEDKSESKIKEKSVKSAVNVISEKKVPSIRSDNSVVANEKIDNGVVVPDKKALKKKHAVSESNLVEKKKIVIKSEAVKSEKLVTESRKEAGEPVKKVAKLGKEPVKSENKVSEVEAEVVKPETNILEFEKEAIELETKVLELEKKVSKLEKEPVKSEKKHFEVEKEVVKPEKNIVEFENKLVKLETKLSEFEKEAITPENKVSETEKESVKSEKKVYNLEKEPVKSEKKVLELVKVPADPGKLNLELEKEAVTSGTIVSELRKEAVKQEKKVSESVKETVRSAEQKSVLETETVDPDSIVGRKEKSAESGTKIKSIQNIKDSVNEVDKSNTSIIREEIVKIVEGESDLKNNLEIVHKSIDSSKSTNKQKKEEALPKVLDENKKQKVTGFEKKETLQLITHPIVEEEKSALKPLQKFPTTEKRVAKKDQIKSRHELLKTDHPLSKIPEEPKSASPTEKKSLSPIYKSKESSDKSPSTKEEELFSVVEKSEQPLIKSELARQHTAAVIVKKEKGERKKKVDAAAVMKIEKKILEDLESPCKILTTAIPETQIAEVPTCVPVKKEEAKKLLLQQPSLPDAEKKVGLLTAATKKKSKETLAVAKHAAPEIDFWSEIKAQESMKVSGTPEKVQSRSVSPAVEQTTIEQPAEVPRQSTEKVDLRLNLSKINTVSEDEDSLKTPIVPEQEDQETPLISDPSTPLIENLNQVPLANLQLTSGDRKLSVVQNGIPAGEYICEKEEPLELTNEIERLSTIKKISKWTNHDNLADLNDVDQDVTPVASTEASPQVSAASSTITKKKVVKKKKASTTGTKKKSEKGESTKTGTKTGTKTKVTSKKAAASPQTSLLKAPMSSSGRISPSQRPPELNKLFYTTPAILLTATPRDLRKVRRAKVKRKKPPSRTPSFSSDSTGSTRSTATTSTSDGSNCEEDAEQKRLASTRSNDSGFDGSPRLSNCDMVCHKKCEKLTGNLCGLNQKLVAEALQAVKSVKSIKAPSQSSENQRNAEGEHFHPSGRITPPATNLPRFKKYEVTDFNFLKVLGKGSFGKVLLAELRGTECVYAVKCLKKDVVLEDDDVECTLIERKVLTLATRHPYLCHLFCTFQTESHLFFVMEYLNGGDLMFHIQKSGRFSEARAKFYAAEIWSGLIFLHKKGIVYRDLKLDNVLLDFEGHIRIADFGMCKLQIFLDRTADTFCGTPDYMAPEIIKGLKYNQAVDWWSFGVLLYEMLTGQSPFSGCDEDELFWSICNERPFIPRYLGQSATDILVCLLEKDSGKRIPGHEIACHPFFCTISWEKLERRQLEPPFKPAVEHTLDTRYFDTAFTAERPRLTPVPEQILTSMDQAVFRGFSYTNPNATD